MIRSEKKIDEFIQREAKGIKEMLKIGSISKDLVTLDIFIENLISDFQVDSTQLDYLRKRSIEILKEKDINIVGM